MSVLCRYCVGTMPVFCRYFAGDYVGLSRHTVRPPLAQVEWLPPSVAEGPKRSEGVSQPEPRRSSGLALAPCARWYSGSRAGWQGLASALGTQVLQTQALSQRLEERAGAGPLSPRRPPWLSHKTLCPRFATDRILRL